MQVLCPGTKRIGFLVENYPSSLIPTSKLANPSQNTSYDKDNSFEHSGINFPKFWSLDVGIDYVWPEHRMLREISS